MPRIFLDDVFIFGWMVLHGKDLSYRKMLYNSNYYLILKWILCKILIPSNSSKKNSIQTILPPESTLFTKFPSQPHSCQSKPSKVHCYHSSINSAKRKTIRSSSQSPKSMQTQRIVLIIQAHAWQPAHPHSHLPLKSLRA